MKDNGEKNFGGRWEANKGMSSMDAAFMQDRKEAAGLYILRLSHCALSLPTRTWSFGEQNVVFLATCLCLGLKKEEKDLAYFCLRLACHDVDARSPSVLQMLADKTRTRKPYLVFLNEPWLCFMICLYVCVWICCEYRVFWVCGIFDRARTILWVTGVDRHSNIQV